MSGRGRDGPALLRHQPYPIARHVDTSQARKPHLTRLHPPRPRPLLSSHLVSHLSSCPWWDCCGLPPVSYSDTGPLQPCPSAQSTRRRAVACGPCAITLPLLFAALRLRDYYGLANFSPQTGPQRLRSPRPKREPIMRNANVRFVIKLSRKVYENQATV